MKGVVSFLYFVHPNSIEVLNADVVMEMDADFSHEPQDVPRLVLLLDQGADFVIGNRYTKGRKILDN